MLRFAKVIETAGHQVLARLRRFTVVCICTNPNCSGTVETPVLLISTQFSDGTINEGRTVEDTLVISLDECNDPQEVLQHFSPTHAGRALELMQGVLYGAISETEQRPLIEELKADLLALTA